MVYTSVPRNAFARSRHWPAYTDGNKMYIKHPRVKQFNEWYEGSDGTIHIKLTQGKETLIDSGDLEKVIGYRWCAQKTRNTFYAVTRVSAGRRKQRAILMHRLIMGDPPGLDIDHCDDGDGINNRRYNLKTTKHRENVLNQKRRRVKKSCDEPGISWNKRNKRFVARTTLDGAEQFFGSFKIKEDAVGAYQRGMRRLLALGLL